MFAESNHQAANFRPNSTDQKVSSFNNGRQNASACLQIQ
ncbi:hypothetical protein GP5015_815 [gamma proteobacterium HTCC5015]|nr:hypothetical protein GP5015_815 [gamma proteobacterium HTCC5015]